MAFDIPRTDCEPMSIFRLYKVIDGTNGLEIELIYTDTRHGVDEHLKTLASGDYVVYPKAACDEYTVRASVVQMVRAGVPVA